MNRNTNTNFTLLPYQPGWLTYKLNTKTNNGNLTSNLDTIFKSFLTVVDVRKTIRRVLFSGVMPQCPADVKQPFRGTGI
jgi:hypothetical protein